MKPIRKDTPIERADVGAMVPDECIKSDKEIWKKLPIKPGMWVLDVGACTGRDLRNIAAAYPGVNCLGIDRYPLSKDVIEGDALSLPFEDKLFDIAYANGVFGDMDDSEIKQTLSEMNRVAHQVFYTEVYEDFSTSFHDGNN